MNDSYVSKVASSNYITLLRVLLVILGIDKSISSFLVEMAWQDKNAGSV